MKSIQESLDHAIKNQPRSDPEVEGPHLVGSDLRHKSKAGTVILFAGVLLLSSTLCTCVLASQPSYFLSITKLDYPREILINSTYRISASVSYSLPKIESYSISTTKWLVAVRLYNSSGNPPSRDTYIASSSINELSGFGTQTFALYGRAPSYERTMNLAVYAMFQTVPSFSGSNPISGPGENNWSYTRGNNSSMTLSIHVTRTATLELQSNVRIPVTVDGYQQYTTDQSGRLEINLLGLQWHLIEVPEEVNLASGVRAVLISWQDGANSASRSVYASSNISLRVTYKTQFFLQVNDNSGSGWYDQGIDVSVVATAKKAARYLDLLGFREVFTGWTGDINSDNLTLTLRMDDPHEVVANWELRFRPGPIRLIVFAILLGVLITIVYKVASVTWKRK